MIISWNEWLEDFSWSTALKIQEKSSSHPFEDIITQGQVLKGFSSCPDPSAFWNFKTHGRQDYLLSKKLMYLLFSFSYFLNVVFHFLIMLLFTFLYFISIFWIHELQTSSSPQVSTFWLYKAIKSPWSGIGRLSVELLAYTAIFVKAFLFSALFKCSKALFINKLSS